MKNNKDKTPVDESVLDETPPNINEEQKEDVPEEEITETEPEDEPNTQVDAPKEQERVQEPEEVAETEEQKDQRYKAQQTEAQIQAAKNRDLINKVDEASKVGDPTVDELKAFVRVDGVDWDELTPFEQSMAKKSYLAEKRFNLVNEAVQSTKKIDEWASKIDEFIDSTDGKPEYIKLSGHEADFRKFAMKESHRGADVESLLLPAFLQNLPAPTKKRQSLFETGGGGDKPDVVGVITDAEESASIRTTKGEKEWKRLVKTGKIKVEV